MIEWSLYLLPFSKSRLFLVKDLNNRRYSEYRNHSSLVIDFDSTTIDMRSIMIIIFKCYYLFKHLNINVMLWDYVSKLNPKL